MLSFKPQKIRPPKVGILLAKGKLLIDMFINLVLVFVCQN